MSGGRTAIARVARLAIIALSLVFIYNVFRFFSFNPEMQGKYFAFKWIIMGHVAGGMLALVTGPFQPSKTFRSRYRRAHRIMGRAYVWLASTLMTWRTAVQKNFKQHEEWAVRSYIATVAFGSHHHLVLLDCSHDCV